MKNSRKTLTGIILLAFVLGSSLIVADEAKFETIGEFGIEDDIADVIDMYGKPVSIKKEIGICPNSGEDANIYLFHGGDSSFMACPEGGTYLIEEINIKGKSPLKTSKNMGIGNTKAEVIKAHGEPMDVGPQYIMYAQDENHDDPCFLFTLKGGKVSEIYLSSSFIACEAGD